MSLPENKLTNSELDVNDRPKGAQIDPIVSTLGMKIGLNIVNIPELTPIFPLQA